MLDLAIGVGVRVQSCLLRVQQAASTGVLIQSPRVTSSSSQITAAPGIG